MTSLDARELLIDAIKAYGEAERNHDFQKALASIEIVARHLGAFESSIREEEQASAKARYARYAR
jgi:hypothetical protein